MVDRNGAINFGVAMMALAIFILTFTIGTISPVGFITTCFLAVGLVLGFLGFTATVSSLFNNRTEAIVLVARAIREADTDTQ